MKKSHIASLVLVSTVAGAFGWDKLDEAIEEKKCADNDWACETTIARTISERLFRYADEETERLSAIIGAETYENFKGCDRTIAIHMELDVARTRIIAEAAHQLRGNELSASQIEWAPPSTDRLFEAFKHFADNRLGFHCGAVDAEYFAEGQNYDDVIRQYAESVSRDHFDFGR